MRVSHVLKGSCTCCGRRMWQPLGPQRSYQLCGELGLEWQRLRVPVALVQRHGEPALPGLRTVAHGTQEGGVAARAVRQLAEDPLGQRRVETT